MSNQPLDIEALGDIRQALELLKAYVGKDFNFESAKIGACAEIAFVKLRDDLEALRARVKELENGLKWTTEKPTEGDNHYHLREWGKNGRTIIFLSGDGAERVTFYNGRQEYLGNINQKSLWAGPIPPPVEPGLAQSEIVCPWSEESGPDDLAGPFCEICFEHSKPWVTDAKEEVKE